MDIHITSENAMIWNTDDAIDLQRNGRMGSSLIGVIVMPPYAKLPGKIKNNRISKHRVGLPLLLMREEVEILKTTGHFLHTCVEKPSESDTDAINLQQSDANLKMVQFYKNKRNQCHKFYGIKGNLADAIITVEPKCLLVPTETAYKRTPIRSGVVAIESFPLMTDHERLKCDVYKDLWSHGFYITSAAKFGGDFLVYPGEPNRFHSFYIAVCHSSRNVELVELANLVRIGVAVKKNAALCYRGDDGIHYITLSWTGIS